MIRIFHTRQEGTLVSGTVSGDSAGPILYSHGFRPSDNLPLDETSGEWAAWYRPSSDRNRANRYAIEQARKALEQADFEVEVSIDDTTPATGFAERERRRYDRADDRVERNGDRAARANSTAARIQEENDEVRGYLNGTPVISNHHSTRRHERLLDTLDRRDQRAGELQREAKAAQTKADTAARFEARRTDVPRTLRRIDALEAKRRRVQRELAANNFDDPVRDADIVEIDEEIAYWKQVVAESGVKVWTQADTPKGSFVNCGGKRWYEVVGRYKRQLKVAVPLDGQAPQVVALKYTDVRDVRSAEQMRELSSQERT